MSGGVFVHGLDFELGDLIRSSDSVTGVSGGVAEGSGSHLDLRSGTGLDLIRSSDSGTGVSGEGSGSHLDLCSGAGLD